MSGDIAHPSPLPFSVAFDPRAEDEVIRRWRGLLRGNHWTHGAALAEFEATWKAWNELPASGFDHQTGAAGPPPDLSQGAGHTLLLQSTTFLPTRHSSLGTGDRTDIHNHK